MYSVEFEHIEFCAAKLALVGIVAFIDSFVY